MSTNKISLPNLFASLQQQMLANLSTNSDFLLHPTTKGDSLENVWIEWLRIYLPKRYNVDKAIVIDHLGFLSHQMDIVIYDKQYTPFVFSQNGIMYIPAESVYAVFEVKPKLTSNHIIYAGDKIKSVRSLKRTSASIVDRGNLHGPRNLTDIIGGILSSVSCVDKDATLKNCLEKLDGIQSIDMGIAIDKYSFSVDYSFNQSGLTDVYENFITTIKSRRLENVSKSTSELALVSFFLHLLNRLQKIGTVAAIDLTTYIQSIESATPSPPSSSNP